MRFSQQSSSCEAHSSLACQKVPCILQSPKVHYCVHKGPPFACMLRHIISRVHTPLQSHFSITYFNIIFPFMPWSSKWLCPSHVSNRNLYTFLFCVIHAACPTLFTALELTLWHWKPTKVYVQCDAEKTKHPLKLLTKNTWSTEWPFKSQRFAEYTGHRVVVLKG